MSKDFNREQQQNKWNQTNQSTNKTQQNPRDEKINQSGGQRPGQGQPNQKPLNPRDPMQKDKRDHK